VVAVGTGEHRTAVFIASPYPPISIRYSSITVFARSDGTPRQAATRFLDPDLLQGDLHELSDTDIFHPVDAEMESDARIAFPCGSRTPASA